MVEKLIRTLIRDKMLFVFWKNILFVYITVAKQPSICRFNLRWSNSRLECNQRKSNKCLQNMLPDIGEKAAALVNSISAVRFLFWSWKKPSAIKMQIIRAKIGQTRSICILKSLNCLLDSEGGNVNKSCENQVSARN